MSHIPDAADIFDEARRLPAGAAREAYLDNACGGNARLRAKIDVLLAADTQAGGFLAEPGAAVDQADGGETAGQVMGRFELLEPIGEGGFGTVWLAEQREPVVRRVALKIIKLGMDTRQVIARFEAERQALAMMDHPGIAKVFDAGTSDTGRPYFVMELVRGVPILDYCDSKKLATRERLALFVRVCQAIQHAHQKGIIHRDIKPSNVLVRLRDDTPVPVVIDFGIAKATNQELTQKTLYTAHHQVVGTPAYMSPEQAEMNGTDIDTRSDVYSLGVLLYELLTGSTPFDVASLLARGYDEMMRVIREEEPRRPSTRISTLGATAATAAAHRQTDVDGLGSALRGDLDWIAMKCLEKGRSRRYDAASALAADIQKYLDDEPVTARPPTWRYRLEKIVKRHRVAVITALAVAIALVLGVIGTTGGMVLAFEQTSRAESAEMLMALQREAARSQAYRAALAAASLSYQNSEFEKGRAFLNKVSPDRRDWIWRVLDAHVDEPLHSFEGSSLAYVGPARLRTVTKRGVEEWDFVGDTNRQLCEIELIRPEVAKLTPDGSLVVIQGRSHGAMLWRVLDAESGSELARILENEVVRGTAIGNHRLAHFTAGKLAIHDLRAGTELVRRPMGEGFAPLAWSPDSRRLAATSDKLGLHLLDAETLERVPGFDSNHERADHAAFDPTGRWLASAKYGQGSGPDTPTEIALCDAATGRRMTNRQIQVTGRFKCFAVSPGGACVAVSTTTATTLLDPVACRVDRTLAGGDLKLCFGPEGREIAVADRSARGLVWSVREAKVLAGHRSYVYPVAFSPDGRRIVSGGWDGRQSNQPGCLRVWDAATGAPVAAWGERGSNIRSLAFTPSGTRLVTCGTALKKGSNPIRIWDMATGALVQEIPGPFSVCAVSPDGTTLAAIDDHSLVLIDADSLERRTGPARQRSWAAVPAFSPNGRRVATARHDRSVTVCDVETLETIELVGHTGTVTTIVFGTDGNTVLTASEDSTIRLWNADTGAVLAVLEGPRSGALCAIFSPDGDHVISGHRDGRIRYWHIEDREVIAELVGHHDYVFSLALAPNGETMVSGSGDGKVRIWGTVPPRMLRQATRDRAAMMAELTALVMRLLDELTAPTAVVERLSATLAERELELASQIVLAELVRRRG